MAMKLDDIYGDGHTLVDPAEAGGGGFLQDEDEVRAVLGRLLCEPGPQADQLRRMAFEDALFEVSLHPSADVSDAAIVECLTDACMQGRVALVRTRRAGGGASTPRTDEEEVVEEDANLPCDFEYLLIKCSHMPDSDPDGKRTMAGAKFWKEDGSDKNDLPAPRSSRAAEKMIEVVAGTEEKDGDEITIELLGGPGYNCGKSHPHVKVTRSGQTIVDKKGETTVKFKAVAPKWSETANGSISAILKRLWGGSGEQNVYLIDVAACGRHPGNEPKAHGRRKQKLRVYDDATYKFSLDIPPLGTRSRKGGGGRYLDGRDDIDAQYRERSRTGKDGVERTQLDITERNADGTLERLESRSTTVEDGVRRTETHMRSADYSGSGVSVGTDRPADSRLVKSATSFSLTREGVELDISAQIGEMLDNLVRFQDRLDEIKDFIQDFQPKVGWSFDIGVELFKGNVGFEWGKKEWTDHTVYDYWKFHIEMTLIAITINADFGIEFEVWWADIVAKVYGVVSIDAKLKTEGESNPDGPKPVSVAVTSEPSGELGVRAALGADWVKAEGKLTAGMTFEAKCEVTDAKPFQIDWRVDRKKVEAKLSGRIRWIGGFDRKWKLYDAKKQWLKGVFPD